MLPDHDGLVAVGGQHDLRLLLIWLVRLRDVHEQPLRRLARFDAAGAFPSAGEEVCAVLTAEAKVTLDLAVPADQTRGVGERCPDVVKSVSKRSSIRTMPCPSADPKLPRMRSPYARCSSCVLLRRRVQEVLPKRLRGDA